mmetsp:Transcript_6044/g.5444  ORF Transcript_6044/g.5444 Transcript_6044/m.5444 type:complete len:142 (+) Transcript_6044:1276-1701(+)
MIRPLKFEYEVDYEDDEMWVKPYSVDFRRRVMSLLGYEFRALQCSLALAIVKPDLKKAVQAEDFKENDERIKLISKDHLEQWISLFDLKRLESYSKNLVDFHLIMDLVPNLSKMYFSNSVVPIGLISLSYLQSAILLGLGL